jgi:hypothetical protein
MGTGLMTRQSRDGAKIRGVGVAWMQVLMAFYFAVEHTQSSPV